MPWDAAVSQPALGVQVAAGRVTSVPFDLVPRLGLTGRLLDKKGQPMPAAVVRLVAEDGSIQEIQADSNGYFRFSELPPGIYDVQWWNDDRVRASRSVRLVDATLVDQDVKESP